MGRDFLSTANLRNYLKLFTELARPAAPVRATGAAFNHARAAADSADIGLLEGIFAMPWLVVGE